MRVGVLESCKDLLVGASGMVRYDTKVPRPARLAIVLLQILAY
jgi:hypothetical protein